tara:strand:+ start:148 stop:252 length:105 start_codon:yes stop_codon:yes gene_type:complete
MLLLVGNDKDEDEDEDGVVRKEEEDNEVLLPKVY